MKNDNHMPGCAALRCAECGALIGGGHCFSPSRPPRACKGLQLGTKPGPCNCELGRLRAEVESLKERLEPTEHARKLLHGQLAKACNELETLRDWKRRACVLLQWWYDNNWRQDNAGRTKELIAEAGQTE